MPVSLLNPVRARTGRLRRRETPAKPTVWRMVLLSIILMALAGVNRTNAATNQWPVRLESSALVNFFRLGNGLYSGAEPHGEAAFAALEKLGIKTILSVDGSKPEVEAAHRHGIRYAHVPLGYDGYESNACVRLSQAAVTLPGPLYVHCHHGKHRGPTAAGVMAMAVLGWTSSQTENWLRQAGTSTNYPGLYATVREFRAPDAQTLATARPDFPETATTAGLTEAMVEIDRAWDHLKLLEPAGFRATAAHPDLVPAREAARLAEALERATTLPEAVQRGSRLAEQLARAGREARQFGVQLGQLKPGADVGADIRRAYTFIGESCVECHRAHRDQAPAARRALAP